MLPEKDQLLLPHSSSCYKHAHKSCPDACRPTLQKQAYPPLAPRALEQNHRQRNDFVHSSIRRSAMDNYSTALEFSFGRRNLSLNTPISLTGNIYCFSKSLEQCLANMM